MPCLYLGFPFWVRPSQTTVWDLVLRCCCSLQPINPSQIVSFHGCFCSVNHGVLVHSHPDYIQCPYCMRRFNETAAQRHINFCKNQTSRRVFDSNQMAARLAARAQVNIFSPDLGICVLACLGRIGRICQGVQLSVLRIMRIRTLITIIRLHGSCLLLALGVAEKEIILKCLKPLGMKTSV